MSVRQITEKKEYYRERSPVFNVVYRGVTLYISAQMTRRHKQGKYYYEEERKLRRAGMSREFVGTLRYRTRRRYQSKTSYRNLLRTHF